MRSGSAALPPLVAITTFRKVVDGRPRVLVGERYTRAVAEAGGVPLLVPVGLPDGGAAAILERVDALLLTGGADVEPARYGQAAHPTTVIEPGRDELELALLAEAERRALPTLCICRGAQVLNVYRGGTLVQDIPSQCAAPLPHTTADRRTERVHPVAVAADSRLAAALGAHELDVNSSHHQSVDRPGAGLRVVAHAPDGVIEGVESTDPAWWAVGVQWHPEELVDDGRAWDRRLFETFLRAVERRREAPAG